MGFEVQRAVTIEPSRARRETRNGRPHLVAPVTMVTEGVLNRALVPFQALEASEPGWNGQPITADHPQVDGTHVPANRSDTEDQHIGVIQDVSADSVTKTLNGDAWVDEQKSYERGGEAAAIARTLAAFADETEASHEDLGFHDDHTPTPIGVSVGYHHDKQAVSGHYGPDQEPYDEVHTGLLPDHLALFIEDKGACSLGDGCGIPAKKGNIAAASDDQMAGAGFDVDMEMLADGGTDGSQQGDRVRWSSSGNGNQYGVVVDDLDGDSDDVLVAVYEPDEDANKWEATDTTQRLTVDSLTGLGRLPPISSVTMNAGQHGSDNCGCGGGSSCTCSHDHGHDDDADTTRAGFLASMERVFDRYIRGPSEGNGASEAHVSDGDNSGASDSDTDDETTMEASKLAEQSAFSVDELEADDALREKVAQTIDSDGDDDGGADAGSGSSSSADGSDGDGSDEYVTKDEMKATVEEAMEKALATQSQQHDRVELVQFLATHTQSDPDDLEDKELSELRAMKEGVESAVGGGMAVNSRHGVNYAGRGIPASGGSDDDGPAMKSPFAAAAQQDRAEGGD